MATLYLIALAGVAFALLAMLAEGLSAVSRQPSLAYESPRWDLADRAASREPVLQPLHAEGVVAVEAGSPASQAAAPAPAGRV